MLLFMIQSMRLRLLHGVLGNTHNVAQLDAAVCLIGSVTYTHAYLAGITF